MSATVVLEAYLSRLDRLEPVTLGPSAGRGRLAHSEDNAELARQVEEAKASTDKMVRLQVALLLLVFVLGLLGAVWMRPSSGAIVAGLSIGSLLVIIERLRRLLVDKVIFEALWAGLREWDPEQVVGLVELLYWHSLRKPRTKAAAKPRSRTLAARRRS